MPYTLHRADEETDAGAYLAYLRAQTEADLLDIVRHLDPDRYPARLDAARRELRRRHVLHLPVYTPQEYAVRTLSVWAVVLSAVTLTLAGLLTESDARAPVWFTDSTLQDGMRVSRIILLMLTTSLRVAVMASVRLGLYPLTLATLAYWVLSRAGRVGRHQARADVWHLALLALLCLTCALALASNPCSALPDIFSSGAPRGLSLLNPFFHA